MKDTLLWGRDAEILASYAQKCDGDAIEIGAYKGGSAILIAKTFIMELFFLLIHMTIRM